MKHQIKKLLTKIGFLGVINLQEVLENKYQVNDQFSIIQIGAHDGISHDFLFDFLNKRKPQGILIEPVKDYFDKLVLNFSIFPNLKKIKLAVHPTDKVVFINRVKKDCEPFVESWAPGSASLFESHLKKYGIPEEYIEKEEVEADTLMNILNNHYPMLQIDLLQVDVEGFDYEVLKMIDFKKIRPALIKFEHMNLGNEVWVASRKLLHRNGYLTFIDKNDTIGIRSNFFKSTLNSIAFNLFWKK